VLLFFDKSRWEARLNSAGCDYSSFTELEHSFERGELCSKEFLSLVEQRYHISSNETRTLFGDIFWPNYKMLNLLSVLSRKLPLILLSNTNELHWELVQSKVPQLSDYFSSFCLSFKEGVRKPLPEIYHRACDGSMESCFFVDDLQENLEGFYKAGGKSGFLYGPEIEEELLAEIDGFIQRF
jgi:FMN phosphatase YigB (HAD superfamily)